MQFLIEALLPFMGRVLAWIAIELLAHFIFYYTGVLTLKIITLGKHPKIWHFEKVTEKHAGRLTLVGLSVWLIILVLLIAYNWG